MSANILAETLELITSESELIQVKSDYKHKITPIITAGNHSNFSSTSGEFCIPQSLAIYPETNDVYICDCANNRVQVFDESLVFIFEFNQYMNAPFGISICHDKVYITQCSAHSLNVYSTDGGYINSVGTRGENELEFLFPTGVDVSNSFHRIYICDNNNNRVQCFNLNLTFNSYISEVFKPIDIKLTSQDIFIMTQRSSIRIYDYSHILTRVLIDQMDESYHFCLDGRYNILLIEYTNSCVIILSNSGDQLHKFGKTGEGINEFISPAGIVTDTKNRIIVVSQNRDYCIQMF